MNRDIGVRRILAVFIDLVVFVVLWIALGALLGAPSFFYALVIFFVADIGLTAYRGVTAGRLITGVRVARLDGTQPGLASAVIRTALILATGWAGLLWVSLVLWWDRERGMSARLWWDAAAGTRLVSSQ